MRFFSCLNDYTPDESFRQLFFFIIKNYRDQTSIIKTAPPDLSHGIDNTELNHDGIRLPATTKCNEMTKWGQPPLHYLKKVTDPINFYQICFFNFQE